MCPTPFFFEMDENQINGKTKRRHFLRGKNLSFNLKSKKKKLLKKTVGNCFSWVFVEGRSAE